MYDHLPENGRTEYHAIENPEEFRDLITSVINIIKGFRDKGHDYGSVKRSDIVTVYPGAAKILLVAVNLVCSGVGGDSYDFAIELEFQKAVSNAKDEKEITELVLAKKCAIIFRKPSKEYKEALYYLLGDISQEIRNEISPRIVGCGFFELPATKRFHDREEI